MTDTPCLIDICILDGPDDGLLVECEILHDCIIAVRDHKTRRELDPNELSRRDIDRVFEKKAADERYYQNC